MGCCESTSYDAVASSEEHEKIYTPSPLLQTNFATPLQSLQFILGKVPGGSTWVTFVNTWEKQNVNPIDMALFIVKAPPSDLPLELRKTLLDFIYHLVKNSVEMVHFFATTVTYPSGALTRLERIRILLKEDNEELAPGEKILDRVGYKSVLFEKIGAGWVIRYTMIVDKSGSMASKDHHDVTRWHDAKRAAEQMSERIERFHTTYGMTLYLFSSPGTHPKFEGLRTCEDIHKIFHHTHPDGSTDLSGVISQVFVDHFAHTQQEHALILTDGVPDNKDAVINALIGGINRLKDENEMGVTIMQVGHDHAAAEFLHELQDCLTEKGARFNVVDCITHHQYHGRQLSAVIQEYLPLAS